ncbi:MAG: hypothetical protein Q4F49_05875 [Pseudoxanthomonas suwonensis]|nr:hypothetical protein [Pseudoxanthomonas suwonensis]
MLILGIRPLRNVREQLAPRSRLAIGASLFMVGGWLFWRWECANRPKVAIPDSSPNAARYEPTDRM